MTMIKNIGSIPQLGFGTWNHNGDDAYNVTRWALDVGFRHIDTAEGYNNEEFVGRAIAESGVARNDVFITTKVGNTDHGYDLALKAFDLTSAI